MSKKKKRTSDVETESVEAEYVESDVSADVLSKSDKFIKLAQSRMTQAIHWLELIERLGNSTIYEYTDEQAEKLCSALDEKVEAIRERLANPNKGVVKTAWTL